MEDIKNASGGQTTGRKGFEKIIKKLLISILFSTKFLVIAFRDHSFLKTKDFFSRYHFILRSKIKKSEADSK